MNRIYRLIWNATLKRWMVASELTRGRGKRTTRTLIAGVTLLLSLPAMADSTIEDLEDEPAERWSALAIQSAQAVAFGARAQTPLAIHEQYALVSDSSYGNATLIGDHSLVLGSKAIVDGANSVAYGNNSYVTGSFGTAIGKGASAMRDNGTALGAGSYAQAISSTAVGHNASAYGQSSIAVGAGAGTNAQDAIAVGWGTNASATASMALGVSSAASGSKAVALGANAVANAQESMALGKGASASKYATGAVALGSGSEASQANTVSVGSSSLKRSIVNVRDGWVSPGSSEAITGNQLYITNQNVATATNTANAARTDASAALSKVNAVSGLISQTASNSAVRVGGENTGSSLYIHNRSGATRVISGVSAGTVSASSNEAVNGSQLSSTNQAVVSATGTANAAKSAADAAMADASSAISIATQLGGLLSQVSPAGEVHVGAQNDGSLLNVHNKSGKGRVISGVADGAVSSDSDQAVTGAQLHQTNTTLAAQQQSVVANAQNIVANRTDIDGNQSGVATNRSDIDLLRSEFDSYVPDLQGVVSFNEDRTIVDLEGARLTGVSPGDVSSESSTDAVTGGQLHATNLRLGRIEEQSKYLSIGSDQESLAAQAGLLGVALGDSARASLDSEGGTAVGAFASALGKDSVAIGRASFVQKDAEAGFALGNRTFVGESGGVAIGIRSEVRDGATNSVALGASSIAVEANTLSVGNSEIKRRVVNIARGFADTDVTSIVQLKETLAGLGGGANVDVNGQVIAPTYALNGQVFHNVGDALVELGGSITSNEESIDNLDQKFQSVFKSAQAQRSDGVGQVALAGAGGTILSNLANGRVEAGSRDAVTGSQLFEAKTEIARNRSELDDIRVASERASSSGFVGTFGSTVDYGGATVTGVADGLVSSDSRDVVNGKQLFSTNSRVDRIEDLSQYLAVGSDEESLAARAGFLSVALGDSARASLDTEGGTAIGPYASALAKNSVALGRASYVQHDAEGGFAVGVGTSVAEKNGIAIGIGSQVLKGATNSMALGYASVAGESDTLSVGNSGIKRRIVNVARGTNDADAATIGQLRASLEKLGGGAGVDAAGQVISPTYSLGKNVYHKLGDALSALDGAVTSNEASIESLDSRFQRIFQEEAPARADGPGHLNLGGPNGMILGNLADGLVAAGSRDAVNGGQLYAVKKELQGQIDGLEGRSSGSNRLAAPMASNDAQSVPETEGGDPAGTPVAQVGDSQSPVKAEGDGAVSVGAEGKERSVKHVARGAADTDAVNVQQLNEAIERSNQYTDMAVEGMNKRLDGMDKRINRMAAMSSAQSAMAMNTAGLQTYNRLGAGVGHSDGESALAVGYQRVLNERGSATFSLNGAFTNSGERSVGVGVGIGW
ncbi:ESPR-type extended signal peptide-containing protein [Stenotrophomonas sp. HMWF023]|uniref:ESPR-type extended signal peptide-containing protein n=1 Tax=Stenotrophomonas sp. HMWF023 TaxID=2056859 RepID=UPI0015E87443|nr:ESPR-type extended signal peptide-containing protein [Stenotrophomonas sp. HMWF023]